MSEITSVNRRQLWSWAWYDFANSAFPLVMVTAFYPLFFRRVVVGGDVGRQDFFWGAAVAASALVTALISPLLGAVADQSRARKRFLIFFATLSCLACGLLFFAGNGMIALAMLLFIIANASFEASIVFYDAFLPEIVPADRIGRVSGMAWALGYFGGVICLASVMPLAKKLPEAETSIAPFLVPLVVALFYFLMSLPTFFLLREPGAGAGRPIQWKAGYHELMSTLRALREPEMRPLLYFFLAYFLYMDAVDTVIAFAGAYSVSTLRFSVGESMVLLVVVNTIAAPGAFVTGRWADSFGVRRVLFGVLGLWVVVCVMSFLTESRATFWGVAVLAALGLGSVQALSRTYLSRLIPAGRTAEFFGLRAICGRFSSMFGPLTFGGLSWVFGQRYAILSLVVFFAAGMWLLRRVRAV
ncbi:MAG: hypothetical protein GMKNLPBB_03210 [Myxococcota bacterium]|nr:hypothetical protein [Myxococcota bacterium]